ncbi:MAG: PA0069 family radical SAM protein [Acidobacteriota bacterium]
MERKSANVRGRGAGVNPVGRFERLRVVSDQPPPERVITELRRDSSRSIIARNDSPDIPFDASINPYRGCEHGCSYCYARPTHEYLGFSPGLDFESKILVKENAAELLRRELSAPRWRPQTLALSGVTDPYQPAEERLRITRGCLEVLAEARHPVVVVTKSARVLRDLDLLTQLARYRAAAVCLSITTLDGELAARLEPRASHPRRRLEALRRLSDAGVPCGVLMSPIVPGLTDHEIPTLLAAASEAGAGFAGYLILRLPGAVGELFEDWLERHYPERKDKVLNRLRSMRDGRLNDPRFGHRFRGQGAFAEQIRDLFHGHRRRLGLDRRGVELSTAAFRRPPGRQRTLFDL